MRPVLIALIALTPLAMPVSAAPKNCPPGLAKKDPACVPPGQAKKYTIGDRIGGDYVRLNDPERFGLNENETYYRVGDTVYRVDRDTKAVLDIIGALATLSN